MGRVLNDATRHEPKDDSGESFDKIDRTCLMA